MYRFRTRSCERKRRYQMTERNKGEMAALEQLHNYRKTIPLTCVIQLADNTQDRHLTHPADLFSRLLTAVLLAEGDVDAELTTISKADGNSGTRGGRRKDCS